MAATSGKRAVLGIPKNLKPATAAWFREAVSEWDLDEHHVRLLTLAAHAYDRAEEARDRLAKDGTYVRDRFDHLKAHPAVAVERDARIQFARLLRELDLDGAPAPESRPPR